MMDKEVTTTESFDILPTPIGNSDEPKLPQGAGNQRSKRLILKRVGANIDDQPIALAFTIDLGHQQPKHPVTVVKWSTAALASLKTLAAAFGGQTPKIRLPTASLRSRIELADQASLRLDRDLGVFTGGVIFWTQTESSICEKNINDVVLEWLVNDVANFAHGEASLRVMMHLKELARTYRAIETSHRVTSPYEWDVSPGRTAKSIVRTSYTDLADFVTHHLEGKTVFPNLSGLRRIASGQLDQNQAELMTDPIEVGRSRFSLVVRVRVFSYPGLHLPIVTIHFSRRVWTSGLKASSSARVVSGYAFPEDSSRALRFTLERMKDKDGLWSYQPAADFAPIARRYFPGSITVDKLLKQGHRLPQCKVQIVLKHGAGERSDVKSGVPDLDKMEGFQSIVKELSVIGLKPWKGLQEIKTSASQPKGEQHWTRRDSEIAADRKKYDLWLEEMVSHIRGCYAGEYHMVVAVQPGNEIEADARLAEELFQKIIGDSVTITRIPISPLVHGPRNDLPGKELKNPSDRAALRIEEWSQFVDVVNAQMTKSGRKVDGILVIAREWYQNDQGKKHDDNVNQRVARITLATRLGIPVQYLRPRAEFRPDPAQPLKAGRSKTPAQVEADIDRSFENRLMIAWLDLAYKSLGRMRPTKLLAEASKLYDIPGTELSYPDKILALGVVRRNQRRFLSNERSFLPFAIELDVESGVCSASFAYEHPQTRQMAYSELLPLPQSLVMLAGLGPVPLVSFGQEHRDKLLPARVQTFYKDQLADFAKRSQHPLVLIDADTSKSVWPWLTDVNIDSTNVYLDGSFHAEAAWPSARIVRIRTDNSPKVLWDREYTGTTEDTGEVIRYHAPDWADAELFKLSEVDATNVYLSFGSNIRTGRVKGRSCHRKIHGMKLSKQSGKFEVADMEEFRDAWATPTGLEIVVVRPNGDDPDQVARLVEWLRQCYAHFGEWTTKPAPLFFERVFKEYIADYDFSEDEDDNDDAGNEDD